MFGSRWRAAHVLAVVALAVAAWSPRPGLTWDEPAYLAQGVQYVHWLNRLLKGQPPGTERVWAQPDHPPLGKFAYGLAAAAPPGGTSPLAAARAVSNVIFALAVWLTTYAAHRGFGERTAWFAGGSVLLTPQVLAHAQLAALDLPMTVTWLAAAAVSLAGPTRWRGAVAIGFLWGLALLTKVNGVFLAGPLLAWGLLQRRIRWRELPVLICVAGLIVLAGWPWLWSDPVGRLTTYLLDKQVRWIVPTLYFGETYAQVYPPWHFPLVMTTATLPIAVLIGVLVGGWVLIRERPPGAGWIAVHVAFTLGLACLPGVPRYDGTRLFLPAFPFLAIVAGVGLARILHHLTALSRGAVLAPAAVVLGVVSAVVPIGTAAPCLLSAYSPLVGGLAGAERLGLETTFWGDAVTPELMSAIPDGARVAAVPLGTDYVQSVRDFGLLPSGVIPASEDLSDVLIIVARQSMLTPELRHQLQSAPALAETRRSGVVLAKLIARH